ncbi:MAG: cyclically-permuted mutarotase family protein [Peptostreptococcus sp.]|uniref:cyclically-permuted mutarotase family protein n=1 Tax=Peptostreptococcus sp. TaxID=1262 RepID=UPI002FC73F02
MLNCKAIGKVAAQKSYKENIGVSGLLYGVLEDKMIIGGGANFPEGGVLEGGKKVTHRDLYLIEDVNDSLKILDHSQLEYPVAYGASTSSNDKVFYLGTNSMGNKSNLLEIYIKDNKLYSKTIKELDFSLENIVSEYVDGKIYFGVGSISGENSGSFYSLDLSDLKICKLKDFPGKLRNQCVSAVLDGSIVVFGGGSNITYSDGYAYNIECGDWKKLSDIVVYGKEISVLGAASSKISEHEMLVVGGFNKDLWKSAVENLSTLKGEELQDYRKKYFSQEASFYNWNKEALLYNYSKDTWKSIGEISFDAPCGNALLKIKNSVYSVMGEIKPGTRTAEIHKINL